VHRSLRPGGRLLDVHPEPAHPRIEVRLGDRLIQAGQADDTTFIDIVLAAREALASVIEAGLFVRERETTFEVRRHFDSVDAWLAYNAEMSDAPVISEALIARTRELLSREPGELRVRRRLRASRLRRP
jgi:hypothetical protein